MKFNDISFPHPVLGIGDAVDSYIKQYKQGVFMPDITKTRDEYLINLDFQFENQKLRELLNDNKCEFLCEVTCSNTLYRKSITSDSNKFEFTIPKKAIKGRVEFLCVLVVKESIDNYSNTQSHSDYNGYSFDLGKGDVLAYFGEFSFNADIKYEKLKAVSSFMEIVENSELTYTNIDLKRAKIRVELPSEAYKLYQSDSISQEPRFSPVFHSSIVLNALLTALYSFEEHRDYLWAQVIEYRLKNDRQLKNISIEEKENIPEIAQRLLGNPFNRLLEGLNEIVESANLYEE